MRYPITFSAPRPQPGDLSMLPEVFIKDRPQIYPGLVLLCDKFVPYGATYYFVQVLRIRPRLVTQYHSFNAINIRILEDRIIELGDNGLGPVVTWRLGSEVWVPDSSLHRPDKRSFERYLELLGATPEELEDKENLKWLSSPW